MVLPVQVRAMEAVIDEASLSVEKDLRVSFKVSNAFTKDMDEAIRSGIPTTFTYVVRLFHIQNVLSSVSLGRWSFTHSVKFDSLAEEFIVESEELGGEPVRTKDFNEMMLLMTTVKELPTVPRWLLKRGAEYEVRIKAELDTVDLPFNLDLLLFFVKFWDFETPWHTIKFKG